MNNNSHAAPHPPNHRTIVNAFERGDFRTVRQLLSLQASESQDDVEMTMIAHAMTFDRALLGVALCMFLVWMAAFSFVV